MKVAGAGAVVGGFASFSLAQGEAIQLGGEVQAWQGQAPAEIEGESNPTLQLQAGTEYEVVWENLDGQPHDFVIRDENGERLVGTEIVSEQGATTSLTFTASEEMATYVCTVHPSSMRGEVQIGQETETTTEDGQQQILPEGPTIGLQRVADGPLTAPVDFAVPPGDNQRRFIVDQVGQIYIHGQNGLQEEPFLDLTDRIVEVGTATDTGFDERGVLGLAFHPNFQENRQFYVRYSAPRQEGTPTDYDHTFVVAEFQANEDLSAANLDSERVLLEIPEPQFNHNAGDLNFGPDGYLYIPVGDGGDADDTGLGHVEDWYDVNDGGNGQDVEQNLLGSVLRIDVDSEGEDKPYGIPDDNPLVDGPGLPEHYAWGFRNPWRISFNDGDLFVADVGQNLWEEIDVVENGGNYGWNIKEGTHCFSTNNPGESPSQCPNQAPDEAPYNGQELTAPIIEYPHTVDGETLGISVTGGYVYHGESVPALQGGYVFGDWSSSFAEPRGSLFIARPRSGMEGAGGATSADGQGTTAGTATDGTETGMTEAGTTTDGGNMTDAGTATESEMAFRQETETGTPETEAGTATTGAGNETTAEGDERTEVETTTGGDGATENPLDNPDLWEMQRLVVNRSETGGINRFVLSFGRDNQGELYVLTNTAYTTGNTGEVYKIVAPEEGEQIETVTPAATTTESGGETTTSSGGETVESEVKAGTETATEGETTTSEETTTQ